MRFTLHIVLRNGINGYRVCHTIILFCAFNVFMYRKADQDDLYDEDWDIDDDINGENMPVKSNTDTCS